MNWSIVDIQLWNQYKAPRNLKNSSPEVTSEVNILLKELALDSPDRIERRIRSSAMGKKKFIYAVAKGRQTGLFHSWEECKSQVDGFGGACYKKFTNSEDAQKFLDAGSYDAYSKVQSSPSGSESPGGNPSAPPSRSFSTFASAPILTVQAGRAFKRDPNSRPFTTLATLSEIREWRLEVDSISAAVEALKISVRNFVAENIFDQIKQGLEAKKKIFD